MKYFKFWVQAKKDGPEFPVVCWGFSNESAELAREMAEQKVDRALEKLADPDRKRGEYYDADPLKERVIEEITDVDNLVGVVTRNAYGALVLNVADVAFLDIDMARARKRGALVSLWKKLTGDGDEEAVELQFAHIKEVLAENRGISGRIYRTANGFRVLITSQNFSPEDEALHQLMQEMGVDELYQRLCKRQKCFRARLTPKPWRAGVSRPPIRYPLVGEYSRVYQKWLQNYETKSKKFRVCRFLESFGEQPICRAAEIVLKIHDIDLADDSHTLA